MCYGNILGFRESIGTSKEMIYSTVQKKGIWEESLLESTNVTRKEPELTVVAGSIRRFEDLTFADLTRRGNLAVAAEPL